MSATMSMNRDISDESPSLPETFEAWRVSDAASARAYAGTGDRGRALIKTCIAALYPACRRESGTDRIDSCVRFRDGMNRRETLTPRPWYVLAVGPGVASPAQLVAAVLPAQARRIPLVAAFRAGGRGSWPPAMLAALELCGVEQVFASSLEGLKSALAHLARTLGPGGVACLGDHAYRDKVRALVPAGCFEHWLPSPVTVGLLAASGVEWDREVLAFSHAGVSIADFSPTSAAELGEPHPWAFFSPPELAPASARLVLAPGREALWDWPDLPTELFFQRRLGYS